MNNERITNILRVIIAIVAIQPVVFGVAWGQATIWDENPDNPIFGEEANSSGPKAYYPSVIYDATEFGGSGIFYKMWYGTSSSQTGLAHSIDGIDWIDQGVLSMPTPGYHATVKYFPAGFSGANLGNNPSSAIMFYRMWFWDPAILYSVAAIRYAESDHGMNWYNDQPLQNSIAPGAVPIITGINPDWNRGSYGPCDVLYNPGAANSGTDWVFSMYYDGATGGEESIGLAFSTDGIIWTGYDANNDGQADPVLTGTFQAGDWDYNFVSRATIIKRADNFYEMWYSGGIDAMNNGIGYAFSSNGITWTRHPGNPVLHRDDAGYPGSAGWRSNRTYCPAVIVIEGIYRMWYAGRSNSGNYSIGTTSAAMPPLGTIPTISEWGKIIMASLLLIAGTLILRRRKVSARAI